jgi:electron transport complex protein RnfB
VGAVTPPLLVAPLLVSRACTGCGGCLLTCPEHAIRPSGNLSAPLLVSAERCTRCGECVEICPADALKEQQW